MRLYAAYTLLFFMLISSDVFAVIPAQPVTVCNQAATICYMGSLGNPFYVQGTVTVLGTFWQAIQPVSGTVSIGNFPAGFNVNNFPSGFNVNNLPASYPGGTMTLAATGQQAVTASAVALPSNTAKEVCIAVLQAGTQVVYFGMTGVTITTGQQILQGGKECRPIANSNLVFVVAPATGSTVAFEVYQ